MPGSRLSLEERWVIQRGLDHGLSQAVIAVAIGRSAATVSREVRRNGGPRSSRVGVRLVGRPARYRAVRGGRSSLGSLVRWQRWSLDC